MTDIPDLESYHFYSEKWESYDELRESFSWEVPEMFNIADYVCDRWGSDAGRVAIFAENDEGDEQTYTFRQMRNVTNRLANYLASQGVSPGDRVAVNVPQKPESAFGHIAAWKLGAISIPLSILFGPDGVGYRLRDSSTTACIVDEGNVDTLREVNDELDHLETVLTVGDVTPQDDEVDFWSALDEHSRYFDSETTQATDDAIIVYTSGTTGDPKGTLLPHKTLLGNLPGFLTAISGLEVGENDVYWMTTEWAWIALFNCVFCPFFYGRPAVGYARRQFDPERAYEIIEKYEVTCFLAVPTALRMMMQNDSSQYDLSSLRVLSAGGEEVGESLMEWTDETFDNAVLHAAYGQTEANLVAGDCAPILEKKPGKFGRAAPGHDVELLNPETAEPLEEAGEVGEFAVRYEGNPVCFKKYWNNSKKTDQKRSDGWHLMEDLGIKDEDGYFEFVSRKDDVILTSGYRVGPEEIEESLTSCEEVAECAVIGVPNDVRGEVPKAFVVLAEGYEPSSDLKETLKQNVKDDLAKYEYPRKIEFVDDLPRSGIGKIKRDALREREDLI